MMKNNNMKAKEYLCIEHGDYFTVVAQSLAQAREYASMYGGEAIRELTPNEEKEQ